MVRRRRDQADARRGEADLRDVAVDLVAGQLAALAGLRALRHLDLELVGVRKVVDVHAEPPGGDLLDRRAARVAVRVAEIARPDPRRPRRCSTCRRCGSSRSRASRAPRGRASRATSRRSRTASRSRRPARPRRAGSASPGRKRSSPRSVARRTASSFTTLRELLVGRHQPPWRTACWSSEIVSGFHWWYSPSLRHA